MQGECGSAVEDDVCDILRRLYVMRDSPHPRRGWERAVAAIGKQLKRQPTVPSKVGGGHWTEEELDKGVFSPKQRCPFEECLWRGEVAEEILDHVAEAHYSLEVKEAVQALGAVAFKAALHTVFNAAVSWSCKQEAPVVSVAQDRRALRIFQGGACRITGFGVFLLRLCASAFTWRGEAENKLEASWEASAWEGARAGDFFGVGSTGTLRHPTPGS